MDRAKKFGFWPSGGYSLLSNAERIKFKKDQQRIAENLDGLIAGLPINVFGHTIEFFNDVTNVLVLNTCYGGGIHLFLPFIFMSSPQNLSYTLITQALLYAPSVIIPVSISTSPLQHSSNYSDSMLGNISYKGKKYYYENHLLFQKFFDGISNFPNFIKKEETNIAKSEAASHEAEPRNYFCRLLNTLAPILDVHGKILRNYISNLPWIKLPGATDWHIVSHIDNNTLVITDVMIRALQFEKTFKPLSLHDKLATLLKNKEHLQQEKSALDHAAISSKERAKRRAQIDDALTKINVSIKDLTSLLQPEKKAAEKPSHHIAERWRKWDEQRRNIAPHPSPIIDAINKDIILITTKNVPNTIDLGYVIYKSIIPLGSPTTPDGSTTILDSITSKNSLVELVKGCFKKPEEQWLIPWFMMLKNTLLFIKRLVCSRDVFTNCIVNYDLSYDSENQSDCGFYYTHNNKRFAFKTEADGSLTPYEISLNQQLFDALIANKSALVNLLIQAGADWAVGKSNIDIIKELIEWRAININKQDNKGWTALMIAAKDGHADIVKLLLANGANPTIKNKNGITALDVSSQYPMIQKLIQQAVNQQKKAQEKKPVIKTPAGKKPVKAPAQKPPAKVPAQKAKPKRR
jgi:hypothetical protein